jgi:hypothetical protein
MVLSSLISLAKFCCAVSLLSVAVQTSVAPPERVLAPIGLVTTSNDGVVLFISVAKRRGDESETAAGIVFSSDHGKSWRSVQEPIDGSTFEFVSDPRESDVWIAGFQYVEGPASDPFVLVPRRGELGWEVHHIYQGAAELDGITLVDPQHLVAWVRHLKLTDKGWVGPEYVHSSADGGRTWKQIGLAAERATGDSKTSRKSPADSSSSAASIVVGPGAP